jgi:alkylhydroperoxidase/carboxymuconolactone decarboxylase family protein YurZ
MSSDQTSATKADIQEALPHVAICAGVPAANDAMKAASEALAEMEGGTIHD